MRVSSWMPVESAMRTMRSKFDATPAASTTAAGQDGAVLDPTGGCCLGVGQGRQIHLGAVMFAARPEQIGVGTGSIKTLSQRRYPAGNQLHLHAGEGSR
jgi:hypothetical protein